jgi:DNA-binding HxlR family transcriptional regulator
METDASPQQSCPSEALKLLGDYVTLRVIDSLRGNELRFQELKRVLGDVNAVTLCGRLRRMEEAGILIRQEETIDRQSVTYRLTEMGLGLIPLLHGIMEFAEKFKLKGSQLA